MFMIATRAVHIGSCLVLLALFAFETFIATPALSGLTEVSSKM